MTKATTCKRCKGQGSVKVAHSKDQVVPASIRDRGATICIACAGEGFINPPELEAQPERKVRVHTYPSWMKDSE